MKIFLQTLVGLLPIILKTAGQDYDYVSECPEENGFFADALQCDRYYECQLGEVSEHFCPDGLVFDEASQSFAKCGFPFSVNCEGRDQLQKPQPTPGCPRQNGYFPHPDPKVCDVFHFCVDGVPNPVTCPSGLIFDPKKGQCGWSDQTDRKGCTSKDLNDFTCPTDGTSPHEHPRYPDPKDCQFFYLCIEGKSRRNGCSEGLVFSPQSLSCERQEKVEGPCHTWYNESHIESLQLPDSSRPRTSNGVALSADVLQARKRPKAPEVPRRQAPVRSQSSPAFANSFGSFPEADFAQPEEEELPPQLAALFGDNQLGTRQSSGVVQQSLEDGERTTFLDSLRGRIGTGGSAPAANTAQTFTRPPPRRTSSVRGQQTPSVRRPPPPPPPPAEGFPADDDEPSAVSPAEFSSQRRPGFRTRPAVSQAIPTVPTVRPTTPAPAEAAPAAVGETGFGRRRRPAQNRVPPSRRQQEQEVEAPAAPTNAGGSRSSALEAGQGRPPISRGHLSRGGIPSRLSTISAFEAERAQEEEEEFEVPRTFGNRGAGVERRGGGGVGRVRSSLDSQQQQLSDTQIVKKTRRNRPEAAARSEAEDAYQAELQAEQRRREEELIRREEEQGRRDDELIRRAQQQKLVDEELGRREEQRIQVEEELKRREEQQKLVDEELERRRKQEKLVEEELERRREQERLVEEELERRRAAAAGQDGDRSRGRGGGVASRGSPPTFSRGGSGGRGAGPRGGQAQEVEEGVQSRTIGRSRGRLEVTQVKVQPTLTTFDEDPTEFQHFNPVRQRTRGAQY